jgi:hypothetical protein
MTYWEEHVSTACGNCNCAVQYRDTLFEVAGGLRRLHNEELRNLYASLNIIKLKKPRRVKWTGNVARMGEMGNMYTKLYLENLKGGDHSEDLDYMRRKYGSGY